MNYAFPPERWLAEIGAMEKGNVLLRAKLVPEGLLITGHCTKCGGHTELVRDIRNRSADDLRSDLEHELEALTLTLSSFGEEHEQCSATPKTHVIPNEVQSLLTMAFEGARAIVGSGDNVDPFIAVRVNDDDHPVMLIPVPMEGEYGTDDRTQGVAKMHFALREYVREHQLDVLGVVMWTEAWTLRVEASADRMEEVAKLTPSEQPDRQEAVVFTVMTPSHVRMGTAPITRASGVQGVGHGSVGDIEWLVGGSFSGTMLEGLVAV